MHVVYRQYGPSRSKNSTVDIDLFTVVARVVPLYKMPLTSDRKNCLRVPTFAVAAQVPLSTLPDV